MLSDNYTTYCLSRSDRSAIASEHGGHPQERKNNTFPGSSIVFIKDMLDADINVYQIFTRKLFKNMPYCQRYQKTTSEICVRNALMQL